MLFKSLNTYSYRTVIKDVRLMEETLHWGGEGGDTPRWVIELAHEMGDIPIYNNNIIVAAKDYVIYELEESVRELQEKIDWMQE